MTGELEEDPGPREVERVIEELVYEHLIDIIDFDRLYQLEQVVHVQLLNLHEKGQLGDIEENVAIERGSAIIDRAWHRVIEDPRRYCDFRGAWEPDDECELCQMLAKESA